MLRSGVRIPPGVIYMVDVAQLVRASVCGSEGRGFESRLPPLNVHKFFDKKSSSVRRIKFYIIDSNIISKHIRGMFSRI